MTTQTKHIVLEPKLRFPEFSGEWESRKLGEVAEINMGQSPLGDSYNTEGIGTALINGPVEFTKRYPVKIKWTSKPTKLCQKDDILFCVRGSTTGRMNISNDVYCIGRGVASIRANDYARTNFIESIITKNLSSLLTLSAGSTFVNLDKSSMIGFPINLPTLPEQEKIADFLSSVDERISTLERKHELLTEYKKGMMQKLFSREVRFKDDDGSVFSDWEERKLGDVLIYTPREIVKPKVKYLAIGIRSHCKGTFQKPNTEPNKIAMDKLFVVKENDLIVNITFAWEGAIAIVKKEDDGGLVSHRFPTYLFDDSLMFDYFRYVIMQKKFRQILELISPGGAGRNRVLSKSEFLKISWTFPSLPEQKKIADFLSGLDEKLEQLTGQISKAKEFKKGLMQRMFV
jgi:type I restriction enzyme, S subunit